MIIDAESSPIIVFGAPRSGTTYVTEILNHHPDIAVTNEIRLMVWVHQALNILTQQDEMIYNDRPEFTLHLQQTFPKLIREFYREIRPNRNYWGDKNPHYAAPEHKGCLETIVSLFPGAHFIHIIRDGRDVVSSILRMGWADFNDAHTYWKNQLDTGCAFGGTQPSDRYFELRYENLIADDTAASEKLFAFLGIEMHSAVTDFCKAQHATRTPVGVATRDLSAGPAESTWAKMLTPEEQSHSLEFIGEYLVRHGYESAASLEGKQQKLSALLSGRRFIKGTQS
jgi:hypothetical protein